MTLVPAVPARPSLPAPSVPLLTAVLTPFTSEEPTS